MLATHLGMVRQRGLNACSRAMIDAFLTRRGRLEGAAAGSVALGMFRFEMTEEIYAQQLQGNSLYDQLGGRLGWDNRRHQWRGRQSRGRPAYQWVFHLPADPAALCG